MKIKYAMLALTCLLAGGCQTTMPLSKPLDPLKPDPRRGSAPQSERMVQRSEAAGADRSAPVLIRIFKASNELELWKKSKEGEYRLVATYRVCRYSGELGPKLRQGDRQAPEGFYSIGPAQLNPYSVEFVSLNTGYPNAFDRAHGRSGGDVMIHGGCRSAGCFAVEHGPAQEIFTAVRDALAHGQKEVQLHVFPYRMTATNDLVYKDSRNSDFWNQLRPGYQRFETTHQDLNVRVTKGRYEIN
jgi:murein L,D-transpeptidase YafK